MAHLREQIVDATVALLIAANTAAGARVSGDRVNPHKKTGLAALAVYTRNDPVNDAASSEMEVGHDLELKITAWATPDAIDDLADQVEVAMRADPYLGGLASDVVFKGTAMETIEKDGRSDPIVATAVLTYAVLYHIPLEPT